MELDGASLCPPNDRAEVRLPVAASRAGTARFRWARSREAGPMPPKSLCPSGRPRPPKPLRLRRAGRRRNHSAGQSAGCCLQTVGAEITTSSTQLQELTDAVLYLMAYPYECSEQISSRVLAVAALRDVLSAFAAKGMPKPEEIKAAMARDIKRLQGLQRDDGGFGFWRRDEAAWPYVSIHVAHALQRAQEKKFEVPDGMLDKSRTYLRNIEQHIPSYYPLDVRRALLAYALYVRHRMGDRDAARARKLIMEAGLENLRSTAVGWPCPCCPATRAQSFKSRRFAASQ